MAAICPNGHKFDPKKNRNCPYCPRDADEDKTQVVTPPKTSPKTQIIPPGEGKDTPSPQTAIPRSYADVPPSPPQIGKPGHTQIINPQTPTSDSPPSSLGRKIVGVLVSYDLRPTGSVYHLFEGKTVIGSDCQQSDVCISAPGLGISGKHLTILFRAGSFRFRDELSTNGTFINGEDISDGELVDKDEIKVGKVRLILLAIPEH